MYRQIGLAGLAVIALTASAGTAGAQDFKYNRSAGGDGGYGSYASGRLTYANRHSSARVRSRGGMSGFYLCSSPYYTSSYRYDCYGRSYPPLNDFGWFGWRQPMY
jgi:hypothetical protein